MYYISLCPQVALFYMDLRGFVLGGRKLRHETFINSRQFINQHSGIGTNTNRAEQLFEFLRYGMVWCGVVWCGVRANYLFLYKLFTGLYKRKKRY